MHTNDQETQRETGTYASEPLKEQNSGRTSQETTSQRNSEDQNAPTTADYRDSNGDVQRVDLIA